MPHEAYLLEDPVAVEQAVQDAVAYLAEADPSLSSVRFRDLQDSVCDYLQCTVEQLKPHRGEVEQFATDAVREWLKKASEPGPSSCGPAIFQRVAEFVPWQSLAGGMQDCISQLCEAVGQGKITETYIPRYLELMASSEAAEQSPLVPDLGALSYGALVAICSAMKVCPPTFISKVELERARDRLVNL